MTTIAYFQHEALRIAYRTWGDRTKPPLLLLHGFTGTSLGWEALAQEWASEYWVLAPELPGHGASMAPVMAQDLSVANTADALAHFMVSLSSKPFSLLGYSFGGRIGLHLVRDVPAKIACAILESTSPGIQDPTLRAERRHQDMALADMIEAQGLDWFIPYWQSLPLFKSQTTLSDPLRQMLNRERRTHTARGLAQSLRGAGTGTQESLWTALSTMRVPILIITGAEDSKYRDIGQAMQAALPNSQWVSLNGAGHNVHLERPHAFSQLVSQFLAQHTH